MTQEQNSQLELEKKAREARLAYAREWRRKNPDKVREYTARYWMNRARKESNSGE